MTVYAEIGGNFQQVGGECPAGWIVMQGERPSPEHVAQGDGSWAIPPAPVPSMITMRQARLAMLHAGILDTVEGLIQAMPGDDGRAARIDWEFARDVRRDWPLVVNLGQSVGMTDAEVDDMFRYAASIPQ